MTNPYEISDDTPVYVISVAAELSGMHPQTLRSYDRLGLVSPGRSAGRGRAGGTRCATSLVLREVQRLSQAGVNLPGIKRIMELETELERFRLAAHRDERRDGAAPDRARVNPGGGRPARRAAAQPRGGRRAGPGAGRAGRSPGTGRPRGRVGGSGPAPAAPDPAAAVREPEPDCRPPGRPAIRRRNPDDGRPPSPPTQVPTTPLNFELQESNLMADKFTRKSQEALADAVRRATAEGNPHVDPLHLLVALIELSGGTAAPLLRAIGADPDAVLADARGAAGQAAQRRPAPR